MLAQITVRGSALNFNINFGPESSFKVTRFVYVLLSGTTKIGAAKGLIRDAAIFESIFGNYLSNCDTIWMLNDRKCPCIVLNYGSLRLEINVF